VEATGGTVDRSDVPTPGDAFQAKPGRSDTGCRIEPAASGDERVWVGGTRPRSWGRLTFLTGPASQAGSTARRISLRASDDASGLRNQMEQLAVVMRQKITTGLGQGPAVRAARTRPESEPDGRVVRRRPKRRIRR
jgi:hypothetical protein